MALNPSDSKWDEFHDPEIVDWKRVRSALEHENTLTNHRLTWLLTSQGFLFAAFALVFEASTKNDVKPEIRVVYEWILGGLAITGILVSVWIGLGIQTAGEQHDCLERWWKDRRKDETRHPPICGHGPRLILRLPYSAFGSIFVVAWLIFLLILFADTLLPYADRIAMVIGGAATVAGLIGFGFLLGRRRSRTLAEPPAAADSARNSITPGS
jgi:hypothetical protein